MQVSKDPDVQARRELQLLKKFKTQEKVTSEVIKDEIQELANTISRDPDLLFSVTTQENPLTESQQRLIKEGKVIVVSSTNIDNIVKELFASDENQTKLLKLSDRKGRKLTTDERRKYGSKWTIKNAINAFNKRDLERIDNASVINFIKKRIFKSEIPVHKIYEQYFISLANKVKGLKNLKVDVVVKEGKTSADLKFTIGGKAYGIEIKMDQARAGSYTWKFDGTSTLKNESVNEKDVQARKDLHSKLEQELIDNGFTIDDVKGGVRGPKLRKLRARQ